MIRATNRKLIGRYITGDYELVVGLDGSQQRRVTLQPDYRGHVCFADPDVLDHLAAELTIAARYLRGELTAEEASL